MINKISGKKQPNSIHHLKVNGTDITNIQDIANTLAKKLSDNSSADNYCNKFRAHKNQAESRPVKFNSCNNEVYNSLFSMDELRDAISKFHDTATGPDDIHYQMLKHLPPNVMTTVLSSLNNIWQDGDFPSEWHFANLIPILRPDKDKSDPSNYRPISLTNCICKIMERMVNSRLTWYLEKNKITTLMQTGFRKGRSTNDQLVRLETFIRETFASRQHAVAIFFWLIKGIWYHLETWY